MDTPQSPQPMPIVEIAPTTRMVSDGCKTLTELHRRLTHLCEHEIPPISCPALITLKRWSASGQLPRKENQYPVHEAMKLCRQSAAAKIRGHQVASKRRPVMDSALEQGATQDLIKAAEALMAASARQTRLLESVVEKMADQAKRVSELERVAIELASVKGLLMRKYDQAHTLLESEVQRLRNQPGSAGGGAGLPAEVEMMLQKMSISVSRILDQVSKPG